MYRCYVEVLTRYRIPVDGHQGYRKAEVTGGGVALDEIDTKSMESLTAPGVFMCGEVCDVFGGAVQVELCCDP